MSVNFLEDMGCSRAVSKRTGFGMMLILVVAMDDEVVVVVIELMGEEVVAFVE